MNIIGLQVEHFKRISAVEIHPNGDPLIQITGKNAEGKSSVLDAIWAALAWRAAAGSIPEPIRRGQESAKVRIDLGDLIITRTWKGDKTTLQVTTRDGAKYSSPQSVLDKRVSEIGFDPLEFCRMQPRDQRATLMNLLKIDFSQFDQERAGLLQKKNLVDNQITGLDQQLSEIPEIPEEVPEQEQAAGDLIKQIQTANDEINTFYRYQKDLDIEKRDLERIQKKIAELEDALDDAKYQLENTINRIQGLSSKISSTIPPDIQPLQEQLSNIEQTNKQVRLKQQKAVILSRLQSAEKDLEDITQNISLIDQDKRDALASAKFPVPGLSFDESGILLNGVPFAQASTAEQIRVSLAMGIALNPDLRVLLIRDGSALDSTSLRMVEEMAKSANMQVWLERVDESGAVGIVIEDGTVKASPVESGQQVIAHV